MKSSHLLALPLLGALALSPLAAAAEDVVPMPIPVVHQRDDAKADTKAILATIYDKETADAAAPHLAEAFSRIPEGKLKIGSDELATLYFARQCFGSEALRQVLQPSTVKYVERPGFQQQAPLEAAMTHDLVQELDRLGTLIASVTNDESEAAALAALDAFPQWFEDFAKEHDKKFRAAGIRSTNLLDSTFLSAILESHLHPVGERLLRAMAELAARREDGCAALQKRLSKVWDIIGWSMGSKRLPNLSPAGMQQHEAMAAALREWVNLAASVQDDAGADAAAEWLDRQNAQMGGRLFTESFLFPDKNAHLPSLLPLLAAAEQSVEVVEERLSEEMYHSPRLRAMLNLHPHIMSYSGRTKLSPLVVLERWEKKLNDTWHNKLFAQLAFVHDKGTADAAAAGIAALLSSPEGADAPLPPGTDLFLRYEADYFGSAELKNALVPMMPDESAELQLFLSHFRPLLQELCARFDALSATIEQVKDDESEATAIAALNGFPSFLAEWKAACAGLRATAPFYLEDYDAIHGFMRGRLVPAADRLAHACGHAQARREGGFPQLQQAVTSLWQEAETLPGFPSLPDMSAAAISRQEGFIHALGEWFSVAASIHDAESAQAAAAWLDAKQAELGTPLFAHWAPPYVAVSPELNITTISYDRDALAPCPCRMQHHFLLDAGDHYLKSATPRYFGAAQLRRHCAILLNSDRDRENNYPFFADRDVVDALFPRPDETDDEDADEYEEEE